MIGGKVDPEAQLETETETAVNTSQQIGAEDNKDALTEQAREIALKIVDDVKNAATADKPANKPADTPLVIPGGQKMDIDGKYGATDAETYKYGTIEELNGARTTQEPPLLELTKEDIEKLNSPAVAKGGRRRTKRKQQKKGKSSKKGGKKHRKSSGNKSRRSSSKKSRRQGRK